MDDAFYEFVDLVQLLWLRRTLLTSCFPSATFKRFASQTDDKNVFTKDMLHIHNADA